jgi:hypothetical protein
VGLSSLFYADTTANTWKDKAFAVTANHTPILWWKTNFRSHGYFTGYIHVALSQNRIFIMDFLSQKEKCLDSLFRYTFCCLVHCIDTTLGALSVKKWIY